MNKKYPIRHAKKSYTNAKEALVGIIIAIPTSVVILTLLFRGQLW